MVEPPHRLGQGSGEHVGVRIVRLIQEGEVYTPLVDARGRILSPELVAHLAATPDPRSRARTLTLVRADESTPRDGEGDPLDLRGFTWPEELPLTFSDSELPIGAARCACCRRARWMARTGRTSWASRR